MANVALVTGGSKGIGKTICQWFLKRGWAVKTCARNGDELGKTVSELKKLGSIEGTVLDLSVRDAVKAYAAKWSTASNWRLPNTPSSFARSDSSPTTSSQGTVSAWPYTRLS